MTIHRYPWGSFPAVWIHAEELAVKRHPDYAAAKTGDSDAAFRLVAALATNNVCHELGSHFPERPILVSAHAVEKEGHNFARNMDTNLKTGGTNDLASAMTASRSLKGITCSEPRMLTESEIALLRQSKVEIAGRVRQLIRESKVKVS
jgi:hypothetical protein